jgi:3-dehydroquinate synthase
VAVVTDETVAARHLPRCRGAVGGGHRACALALPAGRGHQGWPEFARCVEWLLEQKVERRDVVVALAAG